MTVIDGPGANLGWPVREGDRRLRRGEVPGYVAPAISHPHSGGWCSIVGGYVARGAAPSALRGKYLYGDVCSGRIYAARLAGDATTTRRLRLVVPYLVSFGEDAVAVCTP